MTDRPDLKLNKCDAAAALSPAARRQHLAVLTAYAETGRPPTPTDLEQAARDSGIDGVEAEDAIAELAYRDLVVFDQAGEIRAAYPFSTAPTPHQVSWAGAPATVYAMCAVDALGMSAMLGRPVVITAAEPGTDKVITVAVDRSRARWNPDGAVVYAGASGTGCCVPSADLTCGHINFFTTADAAHAWAARTPRVSGALLDQDQALACGIAEFGSLMRPTADPTRG